MRKLLSMIIVLTMILSLTACSGGEDNSSTNTEEPKQETSTTQTTASPQKEDEETKPYIWERSESDILKRLEYMLSCQALFGGDFSVKSLSSTEQGGSYQIMKNDVETKCGIMFTNYTSEGIKKTNISLVIADYNDNDSMQAYVLCASIIMYEGDVDGNYDTLKAAKDAFVEFGSNIETNPKKEVISNTEYTLSIYDSVTMLTVNDPDDPAPLEKYTSTQEDTDSANTSQSSTESSANTQGKQPTSTSITEGMYLVGSDIQAGTYKLTANSGSSGYYARYSDASGESSSIISNDNFNNTSYVTVNDGEYLKLTRCTGVLQ